MIQWYHYPFLFMLGVMWVYGVWMWGVVPFLEWRKKAKERIRKEVDRRIELESAMRLPVTTQNGGMVRPSTPISDPPPISGRPLHEVLREHDSILDEITEELQFSDSNIDEEGPLEPAIPISDEELRRVADEEFMRMGEAFAAIAAGDETIDQMARQLTDDFESDRVVTLGSGEKMVYDPRQHTLVPLSQAQKARYMGRKVEEKPKDPPQKSGKRRMRRKLEL